MSNLEKLLADSALAHAALRSCGFSLAIIDAAAPGRPVVYANPAFEKFFGLRPGEAAGLPLALLIFRGDEAKLYRLLAQGPSDRELETWSKDGSVRHVEMTLGAVRNPEGRLTHWVAGFTDLERLKALAVAA
ncbi:MAG TPA: PAS domain-containing protein [Burkholderiales bacterium]|nr:PAS domain-containing protein [Burkholderiales bacterium]